MTAAAPASPLPNASFAGAPTSALHRPRGEADLPDAAFSMMVRVYYEDTDAGGIVYYANWLRYFERARTDWLRTLGAEHRRLAAESGVLLVVREIALDYRRPAQLDDELIVDVRPQSVRRASCLLWQAARLVGQTEPRVLARVRIAAIRRTDGRATGLPPWLHERLSTGLPSSGDEEHTMNER